VVAANDTYVSASARTTNYGSATTLRVDASPTMKSYLRFTLPTLSGTITKAVLRLTPAANVNAAFDLRAVGNATWAEKSVTYANAPSIGKSIARSPTSLRSGVALSFDVTATIKSGLRSFALINTGSSSTIQINSSEATTSSRRPALVLTINTPAPSGGPCGRLAAPVPVQHVIWIFMENHGYSQVVGSTAAPFENTLLEQCGLAANMHAETHPSLPNYIAATSGDTQGVTDDGSPAAHPLDVPSIFSQVKDAGMTWRSYQESAPANCSLEPSYPYAVKHDPAAYYTGIRDDCAAWDVPMGTTTGGNLLTDLNADMLPAFSFMTPNLCNDTHDCSVATGDAWLAAWFAKIVASPGYQNGSTVIFLTWDEDEGAESNRIPTIVVSPSTRVKTVSTTSFSHYSLLKTTAEPPGIPTFIGHAGDPETNSMRADFNL
jgi:phospholipase C